jgi:hypothetical protein
MKDLVKTISKLTVEPGIFEIEVQSGEYIVKEGVVILQVMLSVSPETKIIQTLRFPLKNLWWLLNKLCLSMGFDMRKGEIIIHSDTKPCLTKKKAWMSVRLYQECNDDGEVILEHFEPFDFYKKLNDNKPSVLGAPHLNDGKFYGDFHKTVMYIGKADTLHLMPRPKAISDE